MTTRSWLRRRWPLVLVLTVAMVGVLWLAVTAFGALADRQRYEQEGQGVREQLLTLARNVEQQNATILECTTAGPNPPPDTGHPCYDRGIKATAAAIADLRRSFDCVGWYTLGRRPPACEDVTERMDAIGRGENPFAPRPPTTTTPTSGDG